MATVRRAGAYVCGIDAAMDVIGGKWKVLILWALNEQPSRFGELRRLVPGVTEKVLASHLRELEEDRIVHREVYDEMPPRVEYSLTALGVSLNEALTPPGAWGRENMLGDCRTPTTHRIRFSCPKPSTTTRTQRPSATTRARGGHMVRRTGPRGGDSSRRRHSVSSAAA
jgi:DNA-binding HxlR family transcriptional regulator